MQATSTPKLVAQPPAALVALAAILFAAGIALGAAMDLDLRIPSTAPVAAPDTSYNAVEGARAQFGVAPDTSYDAVEGIRAQSGVTVDTNRDVLQDARSKVRGYPSTRGRGISAHDKARAAGGWWASAPSGTVAGTPVSQADPNDRISGGIR